MLTVTASALAGGRTTSLRVEKTARLFTAEKVSRTLQEYDAEQVADAQEADEARRRSDVEILAENFRVFLQEEPARNSQFNKAVPASERTRLLSLVNGKLPSALGRTLSDEELLQVRTELQNGVRRYMNLVGRSIPQWLIW
jgi:hypothetical protein